jgi:hypothetical protein
MKKIFYFAIAFACVLCLECKNDEGNENKEQMVRVYGCVVDDNGDPITHATVTIDEQKCLTGADGMYEISLTPSEIVGYYANIRVSIPGHTCDFNGSEIGTVTLNPITATTSRHDARCRLVGYNGSCYYTVCD